MELLRWDVIVSYLPLYRDAMFLTLRIGWAGIFAAVGLGFVCALIRHFRVPILQNIVGIYIELFRNTPLLVQLFFLYFATWRRLSGAALRRSSRSRWRARCRWG